MKISNILKIAIPCILISIANPASSAIIQLAANIDGPQANAGAGTGSPGTGSATMTLDDTTNLFSWNIAWSGLTGSEVVAHFHGPALPNQNAGVQVGFSIVSPEIDSAVLSASQAADLLAGLWYINIHTTTAAAGEIRGQVQVVPIPAAAWLFGTALLGLGIAKRKKT